jgi:hypothetical protein
MKKFHTILVFLLPVTSTRLRGECTDVYDDYKPSSLNLKKTNDG